MAKTLNIGKFVVAKEDAVKYKEMIVDAFKEMDFGVMETRNPSGDLIVFTGQCTKFDAVKEGDPIPHYDFLIDQPDGEYPKFMGIKKRGN